MSNDILMPSMDNWDPDQLFVCPYDKVHRILAKRYPYHIMKCRKNHRGAKMHFCPFNARHIIPISELRHHVANCPDRSTIEPDIAYAQSQNGTDCSYMKGDTSVPSYHHEHYPPSSENWDVENTRMSRTYQRQDEPEKIHSLVGMSKAQRREFNRKLLEVHRGKEMSSDEETMEQEQPQNEMRRPKQLPKVAAVLEQQQHATQNVSNSIGRGGPIGLGRAMLLPSQAAMPRPGTTVQGRSIAANIFNSPDTQQNGMQETPRVGTRRTPTVAMASANTAPSVPSVTPQSDFNTQPPLPSMPNLVGLGRGLGIPRGGYRPGLGMPAVGLQSRNQTTLAQHPGMQN